MKRIILFLLTAIFVISLAVNSSAADKPNILVIMGDDIGYWNISTYNQGMMGYETPNIDRIAKEGMFFTDAYGEQSCTAGRAAFITGQLPVRTGLTKVGLPGAELGMKAETPTLAEYLKSKGYMTGQFGKNHFGDRDEHLPTNHGFDEFFGNLCHLNAEEEPEHEDWFPTLLAAVGETDIKEKLKKGVTIGKKNFKVHIDGYNFLPYFKGDMKEGPRKEFFYFSDTGDLLNLRYNHWKIVFAEQRAHGFEVWQEPFTFLRLPKLFNLRSDPFERADHEAPGYADWRARRLYALVPAQAYVAQFLATFKEFPPRQKAASFTIGNVLDKLQPLSK